MFRISLLTSSFAAIILLVSSGCTASRNTDPRSPSEVFFDVMFGILEQTDDERFDEQNRSALEKRRQWQCENLSESELSDLGIRK
ncbi:hypothetical protein MFFC18_13680 [Mariniblastus fucicola]|uniref:DUF1127 domain-containing protein n=1 Tax=Mariniblastus fucicola TaxID=980251 RepID=A0A5B9P9A8_9BACT|nr:hypothetical protein MFFC18_13680 [Mariniblastus fucicola]